MARFDDAGMHGANRHLMDLIATHFEIVDARWLHARKNLVLRRSPPGVTSRHIRSVIANRFQPGMTFGNDTPLLGDLALEPMCLRRVDGQRGVAIADIGAIDRELAVHDMIGYREEANCLSRLRHAKQGR